MPSHRNHKTHVSQKLALKQATAQIERERYTHGGKKKVRIDWERQQKGINNKSHVFGCCDRVLNNEFIKQCLIVVSQRTPIELAYGRKLSSAPKFHNIMQNNVA